MLFFRCLQSVRWSVALWWVRPLCFAWVVGVAYAGVDGLGPQGGMRTYRENYKDMVLAQCLAVAYGGKAGEDAANSAGVIQYAWTDYDWERYPLDETVTPLIQRWLAQDYRKRLHSADGTQEDLRFDLLKCLDLYHSKKLDELVDHAVRYPQCVFARSRKGQCGQ